LPGSNKSEAAQSNKTKRRKKLGSLRCSGTEKKGGAFAKATKSMIDMVGLHQIYFVPAK